MKKKKKINKNNSKTSQTYKDSNIFSCSKGSTGKIPVKQLKQSSRIIIYKISLYIYRNKYIN